MGLFHNVIDFNTLFSNGMFSLYFVIDPRNLYIIFPIFTSYTCCPYLT